MCSVMASDPLQNAARLANAHPACASFGQAFGKVRNGVVQIWAALLQGPVLVEVPDQSMQGQLVPSERLGQSVHNTIVCAGS